jgi:hypothetical protein
LVDGRPIRRGSAGDGQTALAIEQATSIEQKELVEGQVINGLMTNGVSIHGKDAGIE